MRIVNSFVNILKNLISKIFESYSNVCILLALYNFNQNRSQFIESFIMILPVPTSDLDAIFGGQLKVFRKIINDDDLRNIPPHSGYIFKVLNPIGDSMLSIKSMFDEFFWVYDIYDKVCVFTDRSSKDNEFIILRHFN